MKRVFISVGMSGRPEEEVKQDLWRARYNIAKHFAPEQVEIVDNYSTVGPEGCGRLWYLGEAIKLLGTCDAVYFTKGYSNHNGCIIERGICDLYGIEAIEGS